VLPRRHDGPDPRRPRGDRPRARRAETWTHELTLPLRAGGLVRVRLARVGGRKVSIVAFLEVVSGSGATAETDGMRAGLTRREREVAGCAARGLSNPQIARELGIAVDTVKQHIAVILSKTGIDGRRGLSIFAGEATPRPAPPAQAWPAAEGTTRRRASTVEPTTKMFRPPAPPGVVEPTAKLRRPKPGSSPG
jgi:DNA-binding CsgD family transcriptional regulator